MIPKKLKEHIPTCFVMVFASQVLEHTSYLT